MAKSTVQRRILIPVDASEHSERAFQWYYESFSQEDDHVIIIHANEGMQIPVFNSAYAYDMPQETWNAMREKEAVQIECLFDKYKALCQRYNIDYEIVAISIKDSTGEAICRAAGPNERNADVIIVGSRGLNLIKRKILGSVSEYLLYEANMPVIVVPPS